MLHRTARTAPLAALLLLLLTLAATPALAEDAVVVAPAPAVQVAQPGIISAEDAIKIALERTGGGNVVEFEMDHKKNGRIEYEIEILTDTKKYEMEIDAHTGEILEYKEKTPKHLRKIYRHK